MVFLWPGAHLAVRHHSVCIRRLDGVVEDRVSWLVYTRVKTYRLGDFRDVSLQRNIRTSRTSSESSTFSPRKLR